VRVSVDKSEIGGSVVAPPSKSMTHRAVICSALAPGRSLVRHPLASEDTEATLRVAEALGVGIDREKESWMIEGGELNSSPAALDCGESGTTLRLMTAVCALVKGESVLVGGPSLSRRPVRPLLDALRQLGVTCESRGDNPPVKVQGRGSIEGSAVSIRGDISSQFVSALLIIAPFARDQLRVEITTKLESAPYVGMTLDVQRSFGINAKATEGFRDFIVERQDYSPTVFDVEGDWSSGAYMLAAGVLAGKTTVLNLHEESKQADASIVDILRKMGAECRIQGNEVAVECAELRGIDLDLTDSPDLFPVVAALCSAAKGESRLRGIRRLRLKESDRIASMVEGLHRMGIDTEPSDESVVIHGGAPEGAVIDPYCDHRIAMAFGVLGLALRGETTIMGAECVSKSYPGFWGDLESLGAGIGRTEDE